MVIRNNNTPAGAGGAIFSNGTNEVVINDSLITENSAGGAGGLFIENLQVLKFTMRNTTVSNNNSAGDFGGLLINRGDVNITNCQITGNVAARSIGGIRVFQAQVLNVSDTTISGNDGMQDNTGGLSTDGADIVNLLRLTVSNNKGTGIGIRSPSGITIIKDSTISNNSLRDFQFFSGEVGGGIAVAPQSRTVKIINTTVSGNSAPHAAGGIFNQGDDTQLINCTVVRNSVINSSGLGGGGIYDGQISGDRTFGNRIKLQNTIVANNAAAVGPDLRIQVTSLGYNIIGNTADSGDTSPTTGDQFNVDPKVGPLADNGGATLTHALLPGSPALDKGKSADVITDQRGLPRPFNNPSIPNAAGGDGADIGAFEDQPANTSTGSNVTVEAPAWDARATFASVSKAGFTILAEIERPSAAGTPPTGYTIMEDAPAYDITTTATFKAPITVCFTVNAITEEAVFARVRVLHGENGVLVDRTDLSSLDFGSRTVCAQVNSPSPFVIALAPLPTNTLLNISTRLRVDTGDNALIGGSSWPARRPRRC